MKGLKINPCVGCRNRCLRIDLLCRQGFDFDLQCWSCGPLFSRSRQVRPQFQSSLAARNLAMDCRVEACVAMVWDRRRIFVLLSRGNTRGESLGRGHLWGGPRCWSSGSPFSKEENKRHRCGNRPSNALLFLLSCQRNVVALSWPRF